MSVKSLGRVYKSFSSVHEYGLAASQVLRLKQAGIPVTICVDKVAASGGYMMACCADKIVAAPFAYLGSIGVVSELPNFYKLLTNNNIDYLLFTAGEFKRTVHHLAENTAEGIEKFQEQLDEVHDAFKSHVATNRPEQLNVDDVATGEAWLACQAISKGLVDELMTSAQYLEEKMKAKDVIRIRRRIFRDDKPSIFDFIFGQYMNILQRLGITQQQPRYSYPRIMARL